MRARSIIFPTLVLVIAVLSTGCGPAKATVGGEVTLDGKPIELGYITFSPADSTKAEPATAELKNSRYEIKTVVGKKYVMISALVIVDKRKESDAPDSPMVHITKEILPERYNVKTELTFDVIAGANTKDWKLESK